MARITRHYRRSANGVWDLRHGWCDLCSIADVEKIWFCIAFAKTTDKKLGCQYRASLSRELRWTRFSIGMPNDDSQRQHGRKKTVKLAAIDSTGLKSRRCSSYCVKRRSRVQNLWQATTYTRFPKVGIVCDVSNHLILEAQASRGPCPEVADFKAKSASMKLAGAAG